MDAIEVLREWVASYDYRPYDESEHVVAAREVLSRIDAALAVDDIDNGMVIVKMREALTGGRE